MTNVPVTRVESVRERVPEYDSARIVSIACVVLIHVIAQYVTPDVRNVGVNRLIMFISRELRFAVPMFAMLTGALIWTRSPGQSREWAAFFSRRFMVVLVPYLVWSAIFVSVGVYLGVKPLGSLTRVVQDLLLGTTWYHLYFVPIIAGIYLFAPLAQAVYRRSAVGLVVVACLVGMVTPTVLARVELHPETAFKLVSLVTSYLPYAAFGAWYASLRQDGSRVVVRVWPMLLAAGFGFRAWVILGDLSRIPVYLSALANLMGYLLPSLGVLGLAVVVSERWPKLGSRVAPWAPCVFGVYLAHPLVLLVIERTMRAVGASPTASISLMAAVWLVTTVGCFVAVRLVSKVGWLWWLHGVPRRSASISDQMARHLS
ncbi:MAG: acyltransferase [Actinomycetota bacterium]|nr:MAG: hypothetical protein FD171_599 [Actinomycetota bacterium]MDO8948923.1 acyltransferase [Actinomycetota bacterium]MDP3630439.1 acyltransferase [Actinomycetota bacterium]